MEVDGERRSSRLDEKATKEGANILSQLKYAPTVFDSKTSGVDVYDPLTKLAKEVYGENAIAKWISEGKKVRDIWEKETPKTQCTNAIGSPDGKVCWLCGTAFYNNLPALTPICEHILPIAQAVFFLELYAKSKPPMMSDTDSDIDVPTIIKLEYGWAHNICNAIKNDSVFIEQDPSNLEGIVRINKFEISNFLDKLKRTGSTLSGSEQIKQVLANKRYYNIVKSNIEERVGHVVNFINKPGKDQINLLTLARTSSFVDPSNVNKTFAEMVNIPNAGNKTSKRKHNGKSIRRPTAKSHGSTSRTRRKVRASARKRT